MYQIKKQNAFGKIRKQWLLSREAFMDIFLCFPTLWFIVLFIVMCLFYSTFFFVSDNNVIVLTMQKITLVGYARQLFWLFFAAYINEAVSKAREVSKIIPDTTKIKNLLIGADLCVKDIAENTFAGIFMTYCLISPMVRKRFKCPETQIEKKIWEVIESKRQPSALAPYSCFYNDYKKAFEFASTSIEEAKNTDKITESFYEDLKTEVAAINSQCNNLIRQQQKQFSKILTIMIIILLYVYSTVGVMENILAARTQNSSFSTLLFFMFLELVIFSGSAAFLKMFVQVMWLYNDEYDVFELNEILREQFIDTTEISSAPEEHNEVVDNSDHIPMVTLGVVHDSVGSVTFYPTNIYANTNVIVNRTDRLAHIVSFDTDLNEL